MVASKGLTLMWLSERAAKNADMAALERRSTMLHATSFD